MGETSTYVELLLNGGADSLVFADEEVLIEYDSDQNLRITSRNGVMMSFSHQNIMEKRLEQNDYIYVMKNNLTLKISKNIAA